MDATAATVGLSAIGLVVTIWLGLHSLNRQHRNSLALQEEQHRRTASLQEAHLRHQLQLDIFREISAQFRTTGSAILGSTSAIRSAVWQLELQDNGLKLGPVSTTSESVREAYDWASQSLIDLTLLWERYEIVFVRFRSARAALQEEERRMRELYSDLSGRLHAFLPFKGGPDPHPFRPNAAELNEIRAFFAAYKFACDNYQGYLLDLQIEAQNVLLGPLFGRTIPPRNPADPSMKVLKPDPDVPWTERPSGRFI